MGIEIPGTQITNAFGIPYCAPSEDQNDFLCSASSHGLNKYLTFWWCVFFLVSDHNRKTKMVTWTEFLSTQQSSVLWTCCTFHFNCYTSGIVTPFEKKH